MCLRWLKAGAEDFPENRTAVYRKAIETIANFTGVLCDDSQYLGGMLEWEGEALGRPIIVDVVAPSPGDWWFVWYVHPSTGQCGSRVAQYIAGDMWFFPDKTFGSIPLTHVLYAGTVSSIPPMEISS